MKSPEKKKHRAFATDKEDSVFGSFGVTRGGLGTAWAMAGKIAVMSSNGGSRQVYRQTVY